MSNDSFYEKVYEIVGLIPKGRITSYGAIAKALGSAKSSRMVGNAIIPAHISLPQLPIHRVVNRIGLLTGRNHFTSPSMQELIESDLETSNCFKYYTSNIINSHFVIT